MYIDHEKKDGNQTFYFGNCVCCGEQFGVSFHDHGSKVIVNSHCGGKKITDPCPNYGKGECKMETCALKRIEKESPNEIDGEFVFAWNLIEEYFREHKSVVIVIRPVPLIRKLIKRIEDKVKDRELNWNLFGMEGEYYASVWK